jgi:hypothetical protein
MLWDFKISFNVNLHIHKLFEKQKSRLVHHCGCHYTRDDGRGTALKENDGDG